MKKRKFNVLDSTAGSFIALLLNIIMVFVVYLIARFEFLFENWSYFSTDLSWSRLSTILWGGYMFDRSAIAYTNLLYIFLMLFPLWAKENRTYRMVCKWLFIVVNGLAFIINLCDSVYFPFTMRRTTTSVFSEFQNENNITDVVFNSVLTHWYLVLLAIAVIFLMWKLYVMPRVEARNIRTARQRWSYAGLMLLFFAISAPLCVGACRGGLGTGIRPITINNANQYVSKPTECALVLNTPFSLLRTIGKNVFKEVDYYPTADEAAKIFSPIHRNEPAFSPVFRKKNVVVIIVESFGREYWGFYNHDLDHGTYKGYTPYMDQIAKKSVTYRWSFANGHKSIDAMPSVLASIPMFVEPFVLTPASMNSYTGLAGILSKEGYHTAFFHGANRGSMGFEAFANKTGFQQYFGRQDYDEDPRFGKGSDDDFDGHWGIWDEPFLQYFCTKMTDMKQPFMTALFTVSSHHPFVVPKEYEGKFPKGKQPIHQCIGYTDMALGKFFAEASKQPWFKNTIFVLTSDHTNQASYPEFESGIGTFSVPLLFYDPSGELQAGMRNMIGQQIDILPTVLSYLGYRKPYFAFGCDLLTTPAEKTFNVNYLNNTYQYVKYGYVLQFNNNRTTGIFTLADRKMEHNLLGRVPVQQRMEQELKAVIQQYMHRMVNNQISINAKKDVHR